MTKRQGKAAKLVRSPERIVAAIRTCQRRRIELLEREKQLKAELRASVKREATVTVMCSAGHTYAEIGEAIGTSRQFAYQLLHPRPR